MDATEQKTNEPTRRRTNQPEQRRALSRNPGAKPGGIQARSGLGFPIDHNNQTKTTEEKTMSQRTCRNCGEPEPEPAILGGVNCPHCGIQYRTDNASAPKVAIIVIALALGIAYLLALLFDFILK